MRVALVHGYYLHDSGSGVYVRELARALVNLGHEVTVVCQEREPEKFDFIDSAYVMDDANAEMNHVHQSRPRYRGTCRLIRPSVSRLAVYVHGPFPGFTADRVATFQDAEPGVRERYIAENVTALRAVFDRWPTELVLAQHLIMQPFVVRAALDGRAPYIVTEHGSALNFSVRRNAALVPYAVRGLEGASTVATVSTAARDDLVAWASQHGLDIASKTAALPPGVAYETFVPGGGRSETIDRLWKMVRPPAGFEITPDDDVIAYAGALRATKGIQHLVAALPLVANRRGRPTRLLVAGAGPARAPLEHLARFTASGDTAGARVIVDSEGDLRSPRENGEVVAGERGSASADCAVAFLGHLDHEQLARMFAASDIAVVPSIFPEAAALVSMEALASGALPLVAYHSGMAPLADYLARELDAPELASLNLGDDLTARLAHLTVRVLERFPTGESDFRRRLHELAAARYPSWESTADHYLATVLEPARQ